MKNIARVEQILDWKLRRGRYEAAWSLVLDVDELGQLWGSRIGAQCILVDFYPMRLVTILEVLFRETVREIVDSDPAMLERAAKLASWIKIDLLFAANLYGQKLSVGDLIAHSLPANSLDQIVSALETLLPGFRAGLSTVVDRVAVEIEGRPAAPIIDNLDNVMRYLSRLFIVRHVLTHERSADKCYEVEEIEQFIAATRKFVTACNEYVRLELYGNVPLTQTDINQQAGEELEKAKARMQSLYDQLVDRGVFSNAELLEEAQRLWELFAEGEANLEASQVEGGSMYPTIWASAMQRLVEDRVRTLDHWLDSETP